MEDDCGKWINMVAHKLKKRLNATLADIGITGVQSRVMRYILEHYEEEPIFQRDVENVFGLSRSTATGILQLLEKNEVIRREGVAHDGRLKSLVPTEKAFQLSARIYDDIRETEAIMTRDIPGDQLQLFLRLAAQMYRNLDD